MRTCALLTLSAALLGAAFWAGPMGPCVLFLIAPLLLLVRGRTPGQAFLLGWLFGSAAWAAAIYWLAGTAAAFLRMPWPLGVLLLGLICAVGGLMGAVMASGLRWLGGGYASSALACAVLLVAIEGYMPAIFPFRFASPLQAHLPAVQSAELFGGAGLAALVALCNAAVCVLVDSRFKRWGFAACMAALLAGNELYGLLRIRQVDARLEELKPRALRVAVLQAAIPIWRKSDPASFRANLESHAALIDKALAGGPVDLVIWPETTYGRDLDYREAWGEPLAPEIAGRPFAERMAEDAPQRVPMLMSALARTRDPATGGVRTYNVAFLKGAGNEFLGMTAKRLRMPFGEFMPLGDVFPVLYRWSPRTRRIAKGRAQRLLTTREGVRLGVLICYEDLDAEYARRYVEAVADVLVNMTNDAWFGRGRAPEQHLRLASLRAVENRRYLLRAVNTGVSAVVDPAGRIRSRLAGGARDVLIDDAVPLRGRTPASRLGRWPYRLALLLLALLALRRASLAPRVETC